MLSFKIKVQTLFIPDLIFVNWYSDEVKQQLDDRIPVQEIDIKIQMNKMKPLATCWLVSAF